MAQAEAPALQGTLDLYRFARSRGMHVVFLTGRPADQRADTEGNSRDAGFGEWSELILKAAGTSVTSAHFKAHQRERLSESGLEILVNIGDLAAGYSESVFELPNLRYWISR